MIWLRDASEVRYVWPFHVAENAIRTTISGSAMAGAESIEDWTANNFRAVGSSSVNNMARWELFRKGIEWDVLSIKIKLWCDSVDEVIEHISQSGKPDEFSFAVILRCAETRYRMLGCAPVDHGEAIVTFEVKKEDLRNELEIIPLLVRREATGLVSPDFANTKAAIVGTGYSSSIWVDEPEALPGRGIQRLWQQFPPSIENALYQLVFERENDLVTPTLYFNSNHPGLKEVLDFRGRKQPKAAVRDSVLVLIATEVWMQLAEYAGRIEKNDPDGEGPESKLASTILRTLKTKAKIERANVVAAIDEDGKRNDLCAAVQHWIRSVEKQEKLFAEIGELVLEES